jgi:hypothetical protein
MDLPTPPAPSEQETNIPPSSLPLRQTSRSPDAIPPPPPPGTAELRRVHSQRTRPAPPATAPSSSSDTSRQETWVHFLRNPSAGADPDTQGPATSGTHPRPLHSSAEAAVREPPNYQEQYDKIMADRKRRLAEPNSPARREAPGPSQHAGSSGTAQQSAGVSAASAIDLTGSTSPSSRPLPPRRYSRPPVPPPPPHTLGRRQSEVVLPRWQPDSEVNSCPVCKTQFTFFYRKHHCRKCGRVVCAQCSPHRITIPRQFIVHPPALPSAIIDLTGEREEDSSPVSPRQMWGGEEVRVCNPCVPDPNMSPPPQLQTLADIAPPPHWNLPNPHNTSGSRPPPRRHRNSAGPLPNIPMHPAHRSTLSDAALLSSGQDPFRYRPLNFTNPSSVRDLWPPTAPPPPHPISASIFYPPRVSSASGIVGTPPPPYRYRSLLDTTTPLPPAPPPPRRQMAEEDECPICSQELPPKGPDGDTTARDAHVEECINLRLYNAQPPAAARTNSTPQVSDVAGSVASASTSMPSASSSSLPASSSMGPSSYASGSGMPRQQRRMTGGRMLTYTATEKDCIGEDGEPWECVICFEEFGEGDRMGRLECFCRFHEVSPMLFFCPVTCSCPALSLFI